MFDARLGVVKSLGEALKLRRKTSSFSETMGSTAIERSETLNARTQALGKARRRTCHHGLRMASRLDHPICLISRAFSMVFDGFRMILLDISGQTRPGQADLRPTDRWR